MRGLQYLILIIAILTSHLATAGNVSVPHQFKAGDKAVADEVNANFSAVKTAVDDNDNRIITVTAQASDNATDIADLQATINQLQDTINTLQSQLAAIQANSVLQLDGRLSLKKLNGYDTALFSGVNVQVVNGVAQTHLNGLGNLIVGYNEARTDGGEVCSNGEFRTQYFCEVSGEVWALNHKSGSHNLVVGRGHSYSRDSGVVFGFQNAINRGGATVTGGRKNIALGYDSTVSGGESNRASSNSSSVSGGYKNTASGVQASVSGGVNNWATAYYASVSGGASNTASGYYASISGGASNSASVNGASVTGGSNNIASGLYSNVSGGGDGTPDGGNKAEHDYSSILGGVGQTTSFDYQTIPPLP